MKKQQKIYTTQQVADKLGLTTSQVRRVAISLGVGERIGHAYIFREADIQAMLARPKVGRPPLRGGQKKS